MRQGPHRASRSQVRTTKLDEGSLRVRLARLTRAALSKRGRANSKFSRSSAKMFTILDYDGVPWYNNRAEHVIKSFAKY